MSCACLAMHAANIAVVERVRPLHDFDGASLTQLLDAAASEAPSISFALPELHGIGATRTCIDLQRPATKEFFWRGKSDGKWLSHELFRDRGNSTAHRAGWRVGTDPCGALSHAGVPVPSTLHPSQRAAAVEMLHLTKPAQERLSMQDLHARLSAIKPAPPAAHFELRRRVLPLNGTVLHLGMRANLDVNRFDCPEHRGQTAPF